MPEAHKERTFRSVLITIFKVIFILSLALAFLSTGAVVSVYLYLAHDLPTVGELRNYQPKHSPQLSSINFENSHISTVHPGLTTDLGDIPPHVVNAFLAAEDWQFLNSPPMTGKDFVRISLRQLLFSERCYCCRYSSNITRLVAGELKRIRGGGFSCRIKRAIMIIRLAEAWERKKILYVFLNKVYLGNGSFGVDAAARFYFGKTVQRLTIAEASQIAALVARPSKYDPFKNADRAQQRKILVLERMRRVEFITEEQYEEALKEKLVFKKAGQKTP